VISVLNSVNNIEQVTHNGSEWFAADSFKMNIDHYIEQLWCKILTIFIEKMCTCERQYTLTV